MWSVFDGLLFFTSSPAEAEVDFTMIPRNPLRPRVFDIPTEANECIAFDRDLQDRTPAPQGTSVALETIHLTSQSGTVTLVPTIADADPIELPPS